MYDSATHSIVFYVQCVFSRLEMLQLTLSKKLSISRSIFNALIVIIRTYVHVAPIPGSP